MLKPQKYAISQNQKQIESDPCDPNLVIRTTIGLSVRMLDSKIQYTRNFNVYILSACIYARYRLECGIIIDKQLLLQHKVAAFDLDGTLLKRNGEVFDYVTAGIEYLIKQGIRPLLVTGRSLDSFNSLFLPSSFIDLFFNIILLSNGDVKYNRATTDITIYNGLDTRYVDSFYYELQKSSDFVFEIKGVHYAESIDVALKYCRLFDTQHTYIKIQSFTNKIQSGLTEIVMFPKAGVDQNFLQRIRFPEAKIHHNEEYISIVPNSSCKSLGISRLLTEEFTDENFTLLDVIAFGDGDNDTGMLSKCRTGIAVRNSTAQAIINADYQLNEDIGLFMLNIISCNR